MRFTAVFLAPLLAVTAHAASLEICLKPLFKDCTTLDAPDDVCVRLSDKYSRHVLSARTLTGAYCQSFRDPECQDEPIVDIHEGGWPGLPLAGATIAIKCYD